MKTLAVTVASAIMLASVPAVANINNTDTEGLYVGQSNININSSSTSISTNGEGEQVNMTTISLARADLRQPHILRINATINNYPMSLSQAAVKINGKLVKTSVNKSIAFNVAPYLSRGRNVVDISARTARTDAAIGVSFKGPNTQVNNQSAGNGSSHQQIVIDVE
jgi:hypothetical protein